MTVEKNSLRYLFIPLLAVAVIAIVALLIAEPFSMASGDRSAATYAHGVLHVTIPYHGKHPGAGTLVMEVLDPEDHVIGRADPNVEVAEGRGRWQQEIKFDKPLALEDLVWHRLRYHLEYSDHREGDAIDGVDSISEILRTPVVHILGQQAYLAGSPAAVRLIVADSKNEIIPGRGSVRIELLTAEKKSTVLYTGPLDRRGTTEAQFRFPAGLVGSYQMRYTADTAIGSTEFTQSVRLEDKVSILLTTEKPLYQPGQSIHVRALALDRAHHDAASGRKLIFELEDSRGNKVFKKITQTSKFGIASADFELADEVNLGTYHLRALMGDGDSGPANHAEIALNVEKYVLPKFKVAIDLGGKDSKAKRGYRPGDHVTGTVRANYFFGKPVEGGEIAVKASGMDVAVFEVASAQGKTDHDGAYHFDLRLPNYFAGRPLEHGLARVLVEATVKDTAGHSESRGEPITVSESPLIITAVPEGGTLAANLENQVFILTSYADGTPATADLKVRGGGAAEQKATSDAGGVAVVHVNAGAGGESQTLEIDASDREGNHVSSKVQLQSRGGQDQILLRTEHAVYRAGDRIQLKVFSTKKRGAAYIDIVKEGQTILTRDLDIENGQAELSLVATPEMAGTVDFSAYLFGSDARPVGDHRLVFVQPADDLKIEAVADAPVYKPGAEARIRFRVTNSRGEGVQAALGLQVVDEAVFALAEKQPGFAKVFFYLEQEVLKPRYEIHSIGMPEIVEPVEKTQADQRDQAARALFSATEMVNNNRFETEFGRTVPTVKYNEYAGRYQQRFLAQARQLAQTISRNQAAHGRNFDDLTRAAALVAPVRDAWGNSLQVEAVRWAPRRYYLVRSAGPDKQPNTGDDLATYLEVYYRKIVGKAGAGVTAMEVNVEHDRGPFNGRAEIMGTATDQAGGALEGAAVRVRNLSTGSTRIVHSGAEGRFRLSGLEAGEYEIVASVGKETASGKVKLDPRDRAVLSVSVREEEESDIVVTDLPGMRERMVLKAGVANGVFDMEPRREALAFNGAGRGDFEFKDKAMALPAAPAALQSADARAQQPITNTATNAKEESGSSAPRVRSYFPEALYINPEIITDGEGRASITIPMADSITTWRMAMVASTTHGALGSGTSSLKVFQDFFVDLDLPVTLTQGDRVSIPIAVYNYTGGKGDVDLQLQPENWFALVDDTGEKSVVAESGQVGGSQFTVEARRIGKFKLTLSARMKGGGGRADIVVREIEVIPNGREQNLVFNGRLDTQVRHELNFPAASIPDASKIFVRLYPGPLSQVIEGMDSILRMPGGCFEQTSSSTYPNVLALDYMKRTKKLTPEVHAKAEGYIANGYQRLLTFEVPGGGFSWFGNPPANKILTSYGLMEFYDMSKVYDVDQKLIDRTQQWLAGQQQADGSWKPDTQFINEGATNRYNNDVLRITAYIAWSLENTGYHGPAVDKAKQYIESHMGDKAKPDAYTLAVLANFAVDYGKDRDFARRAVQMLLDARTEKDEQAWWSADETSVYATGASASVETTGLAVQALLKWGQASAVARKAMVYIASKKDASGTWGTTQATIMALRALLLATEKGSGDVRGTVEVIVNGKTMQKLTLTPENNDLLHQFVFKGGDSREPNTVELRFEGKGGLAYQVVGRHFVPWDQKPENEPLSIDVAYDRTRLAQDDVVTATATVRNNLNKTANMVMVDLGIPPGFDLLSEDLQSYQEKSAGLKSGRLEKFSQTATQAILYFDSFAAHDTVKLSFRLRAKYPIKAKTFKSRVYEYYDPDVQAIARPVQLEVKGK